jgi:Glutamine amidotransferase domain
VCGIVGALSFESNRFAVTSPYLEAMRDAMVHRGPDGEGVWIADDGRVGLAFRRLKIIDLSDRASQPMSNEDGSLRLVYNGEIYNHPEIRRELELRTLRVRVWMSGLSWADGRRTRDRPTTRPTHGRRRSTLPWTRRAYGIEPVLYVNGFPSWSNGGRDGSWVPKNPADYGDFMAAAVARYPQVRRWIAFSEPSHMVNFRPQGEGGRRAPRL